jgi:hypothetical protein
MTQARTPSADILPLAEARLNMLRDELSTWERFAEPVDESRYPQGLALVCLVGNTDGETFYIARAKRGFRAGTGLRRLNLSEFVELTPGVRLTDLLPEVPQAIRRGLSTVLRNGGMLTAKQFRALVDAAIERGGKVGELLARYSTIHMERVKALSAATQRELAFQKEAIGTALAISGIDRAEHQAWEPPMVGKPASFLDGIPQARVREDPIRQRFCEIPGLRTRPNYHYWLRSLLQR